MENTTLEIVEYYLPEGTLLDGRYRILRVLGCGGFGITYEAVNENTGGHVAIKEFYNRNYMGRSEKSIVLTDREMQIPFQQAKEKFLKEARRLRDYSGEPGVVHIRNYFEENNTAYIVMEYIGGISLQEYFQRKGRIEAGKLFRLLYPLMVTLEKIHKSGVVHRDISPDNIKFSDDPDLETGIKLIDFGSARDYMDTRTLTIELKEGYAPPEQYYGHEQGPWTDVYALCAVLYCGITGQKPERSSLRKLKDELLMPSQLGIAIDPKLEKILKKGLSIEKEKRYQNLEELLADLKPVLFPEKKEKGGNKKGKIFLAASISLCLLAGAGYGGWKYYQDHLSYFKFHGARTETVLLTPYDDMSTKDYKKNLKIIKKRLNYIWGKEGYILKEKEDGLEITTTLESYDAENIDRDVFERMRKYVAQPLKMGIVATTGTSGRVAYLDREDILSVEKKTGEIPVKTAASETENQDKSSREYVEVKISEDAAERIKAKLKDLAEEDTGETLLVTDPGTEYRSRYIMETDVEGDWTTYYCTVNKKANTWKALWKTEELSDPFKISYELQADWEEESGIWGKYQCQEKDIYEPAVTVEYRAGSELGDNNMMQSAGAWNELLYDIKARMDTMKIPYAVGICPDNTGKILIKTAQKDTNPFLEKMFSGAIDISVENEDISQRYDLYSPESLKVQKDDSGNYAIEIAFSKYQQEDMEPLIEAVKQSEDHRLYLNVNGYRIAWTELNGEEIPDTYVFSDSCFENSNVFTEKELPFLKFVETAWKQNQIVGYETYSYGYSQYSSKNNPVEAEAREENEQYMPDTAQLEKIQKVLHSINQDAEAEENRAASRNRLYITLRYDMNKGYASKVAADIEKLFQKAEDDLKTYDEILVYPGYKQRGTGVKFTRSSLLSDSIIENWKYLYYSADQEDEEQSKLGELLEKSEILGKYRTEESVVKNQNWWWYNSVLW